MMPVITIGNTKAPCLCFSDQRKGASHTWPSVGGKIPVNHNHWMWLLQEQRRLKLEQGKRIELDLEPVLERVLATARRPLWEAAPPEDLTQS